MNTKTAHVKQNNAKNITVGKRLREERERLEYSQTEFAKRCEISKRTQIQYEQGRTFPNAEYLSLAADLGCDRNYILTGRNETRLLDEQRQELLKAYDAAPDILKRAALAVLCVSAGTGRGKAKGGKA